MATLNRELGRNRGRWKVTAFSAETKLLKKAFAFAFIPFRGSCSATCLKTIMFVEVLAMVRMLKIREMNWEI